jgi:hypothetical protein
LKIVLTGGAAGILQGVTRATYDIDFEIHVTRTIEWESVQRAIEETVRATGIAAQYAEDIDRWSLIALPGKRSRLYRRFGKIEVRILDPELWAIGKLTRYLSTDIQDLRVVLKKANLSAKTAVSTWGKALGKSPASSAQTTFRRQVESFLDQYAREIWGAKEDSTALNQLFLASAQKAKRRS